MDWTEIKIYTTTDGIEPLTIELLKLGISGFVIEDAEDFREFIENKNGQWDYIDDELLKLADAETNVTVYLPVNLQGADTLSALKAMLVELKQRDEENKYGRLVAELSGIREEDWANNWKQYFKPFKVGEKLYIKPSWEEASDCEGRVILEIDPASSFGTGQHHTTRLCLEMLEGLIKPEARVLDLGCGSGILSIAAALLGASEVCAVDIAENAAVTAAENAEKNGVSLRTFCGNILTDAELTAKIGGGYDLICANIVADVLIAMADMFAGFLKPDGKLIISGIISERADEVVGVVTAASFKTITRSEREGWTAVLLERG